MLILVVKSNWVNHIFLVKLVAVDANLGISSLFKEVEGNLRELCIRKNILRLFNPLLNLATELIKLRLKLICRTAFDNLLVTDNLLLKLRINRHWSCTVLTGNKSLELVCAH